MLAHRLRRGSNIKPALVQRLVFAGLRSIAAGLVMFTAGGDYKPTLTQCMLNVGAASPVLASIHSALVSTSCFHARVPFERAVTGKRERSDASEK